MRYTIAVCLFALLVNLPAGSARAAALPDYDAKVEAISNELGKAAALYRTKKFEELGKLVADAQRTLDEIKNGEHKDQLAASLVPLERRLEAAQQLIQAGLEANLKKPAKPAARTTAARPMNKPMPGKPMPGKPMAKMMAVAGGPPGMSFARDIGPLLLSKCGRCHGDVAPKGGFSVANYATIRRGSDTGQVFVPGKGQGSTLIELLETGDMPRGGGKLSDDQIAMISKWIDAGAPYDADPMSLAMESGSAPTGNETVSFMKDIAPVIVGNCVGCHGGMQGADNLLLENFNQIKRGGRTGDLLSAGNPSSSLLIQMLRGTAKDRTGPRRRMPDRRPPLSEDVIKKFETWIAEGAKFDGDDPGQSLDFLLRVILAQNSSHEDLSKRRLDLAKRNWALGNPGVTPEIIEEPDFRVIGDLTPVRMKEIAQLAKTVQGKVASALKVPPGKPMYKGKLTVFLFKKRFEYSEFGQMVEKRELSSDMYGHFHYNVVDGYACVLVGPEGDPNTGLLLAEGFAGSYVDTLARNVPRWFSVGVGRTVAARMEPRAPLLKQWDDGIAAAASSTRNLGQLLNAKEVDASSSVLSYALVRGMLGRGSAQQTMLDAMRKGQPFNQAFVRAFGGMPDVVAAASLR